MAQYRDGLFIAGLTFQYAGTAKTVLNEVSLHIPKGAFICCAVHRAVVNLHYCVVWRRL